MNQRMFKVTLAAVVVMLASPGASAQVGALADVCRPPSVPFVITEPIPAGDLADVFGTFDGITGTRLSTPNLRAAAFLSRLDIDGDGIPDNAPDTDGDGLPDNWEIGGFEALTADRDAVDRVVFFPAPTAVVPGTPPTPIFSRRPVATSALNPDTDGDGLTDFVEVFGLMFIDEDRDGILTATEWSDKNGDALPSPGEFPRDNSGSKISRPPAGPDDQSLNLLHDFDGFVFTDPTNFDTDGDSCADGDDVDPLINPRAFGTAGALIVRFSDKEKPDIDRDGLGNGMDLGNDLIAGDADAGSQTFQVIDNPQNIRDLLNTFRSDLLPGGFVPEAEIEDLLGADWDGSGLWRTTDALGWRIVTDPDDPSNPTEFSLPDGSHTFMASQTFEEFREAMDVDNPYDERLRDGGNTGIGLGWQELLRPSGPSGATEFIPDPTVWAILYSWRVPGFDIDGDGFVGVPEVSNIVVEQRVRFTEIIDGSETPHTDEIALVSEELSDIENPDAELDGIVDAPDGFPTIPTLCGNMGALFFLMLGIGFCAPRVMRR